MVACRKRKKELRDGSWQVPAEAESLIIHHSSSRLLFGTFIAAIYYDLVSLRIKPHAHAPKKNHVD